MGYTHYWRIKGPTSKEKWAKVTEAAMAVIENAKVPIQREYDDTAPPVVNSDEIRFNGVDNDGHETFFISRSDTGFNFTKTARKPYDEVVVAMLKAIKKVLGSAITLSSDGGDEVFADVEIDPAKVANAMREYGGGFVKALAEAIVRADSENLEKLKGAFPDLFEKYGKMAE